MARQLAKLSARRVATVQEPGRHSDGGGLYLVVDPKKQDEEGKPAKRWVFLFRWKDNASPGAGRLREMGLGGLDTVSLPEARDLAEAARKLVQKRIDPIAAKRAAREVPTFGAVADQLLADLEPQWRNAKHRAQWETALKTQAAALRPLKVDAVTTDDVVKVLKPIWLTLPETASRLRGRIERVLAAAGARGFRSGPNPALWRGHLDKLLPKRQRLARGHHKALPFAQIPEFMGALREREAVAALALEFLILTAARSGEVLGALWPEIDLTAKVWTVPAERMKAGREHRVPLSAAAVAVLEKVKPLRDGEYVFPGPSKTSSNTGRPLSGMSMAMLLRRMERPVTVHGFRSSFRDWAGEVTTFPREIAEAALAHAVGDAVETAYRRGDALEKRRKLMEAWARYCGGKVKS
jgi:integrase